MRADRGRPPTTVSGSKLNRRARGVERTIQAKTELEEVQSKLSAAQVRIVQLQASVREGLDRIDKLASAVFLAEDRAELDRANAERAAARLATTEKERAREAQRCTRLIVANDELTDRIFQLSRDARRALPVPTLRQAELLAECDSIYRAMRSVGTF